MQPISKEVLVNQLMIGKKYIGIPTRLRDIFCIINGIFSEYYNINYSTDTVQMIRLYTCKRFIYNVLGSKENVPFTIRIGMNNILDSEQRYRFYHVIELQDEIKERVLL